jgi:hypothetical protein
MTALPLEVEFVGGRGRTSRFMASETVKSPGFSGRIGLSWRSTKCNLDCRSSLMAIQNQTSIAQDVRVIYDRIKESIESTHEN